MPKLSAVIRSKGEFALDGEGSDLAALLEVLVAKVPDEFEVVSVLGESKQGLKVTAQSTQTREIQAEGADYLAARQALLAQFDASDWKLLFVRQGD